MKIFTLTGGIASGKSTVCKILEKANCIIVDTDKIAHDVVKKGETAWKQIIDYFGDKILKSNGQLDRIKLGNIVFNNSRERNQLNNIIHPHIFHQTNKKIKRIQENNSNNSILIVDIPLFFETSTIKKNSNVIVVYVPEHIQLKRLIKRNGFNKKDAIARIKSQISMHKKKKMGTIIIDNSGSLKRTEKIIHTVLYDIKKENIHTK